MLKVHILLLVILLNACSPLSAQLPQRGDYLGSVEGYLVENIGIASFGGHAFCSYEVLDAEQENIKVDV